MTSRDARTSTPAPTETVSVQDPGVRRRRRNLAIIAASLGIDTSENGIINALFPVIQASLGLATSALGVLVAAGRVSGTFAGPIGVALASRFGRRNVLAVALGLWGIWAIAAGLSQEYWQLLLFYTVSVCGVSAGTAIAPSIIADSFPEERRGRATGWLFGLLALAGAIFAPLLGQLARVPEGWRFGFFGFALINFIVGILVLTLYRDPATGSADPQLADIDPLERAAAGRLTWPKVVSLVRIPTIAVLAASRVLAGNSVLGIYGVVLLVQVYGYRTEVAAAALLPFGLGYLFGSVLAGYLGDLLNRSSPSYGRVGLVQGAQFAFAALLAIALSVGGANFGVFLLFFAALGVLIACDQGPSRPIAMAVALPELRASALALTYGAEMAGVVLVTVITGFVADRAGLLTAMVIFGVVVVAVKGLVMTPMYVTFRRDRARVAEQLDLRRDRILTEEQAPGATSLP